MSDFITIFFGSLVLTSLVIILHLIAAYHPYHNPIPLVISSTVVIICGVYATSLLNSDMTNIEAMRESVSVSISSIMDIVPLIYIFITLILAKVSVRKRGPMPQ
jgi:hypothetical protein